MKTLFPQTSKKHFLLLLLNVAVLFTAAVLWFIWRVSGGDDGQFPVARLNNSVWLAAAIISILAVFLAACLVKIRALHKSHKALLISNTERTRTEKTLRESDSRYRMLFDDNPNPVLVYDLETLQILAVNDEAMRYYGYSREEFLTITAKDIRSTDEVPVLLEQIARAAAAGEKSHYSSRHRKKNGVIIEVEVVGHHLTFEGRAARLVLITDVTERKRAEENLRESEFRLRTLIESTSEGIVQVDNDEKIEFVNDSFCEIIGYAREELLGKITLDIFFDDEGQKLVAEANRERPDGVSSRYEVFLKTKSGEKLWVVICGAPIMDEAGVLVGTMAVFTNMTERKRAETALRESEYKLRTLVEKMSEGLLQVDNDDAIQFVNNYFCEMLGYSPDELIGKVWTELILDDEGREFIKKVNRRRREGISDRYELRMRKKTGETIWTLVGGVPLFDADNLVSGSLGIFTDITTRKRAEEQLLHDAFHDALTGLANRALFMDHLRMTIERSKSRHSNFYAVLFLDFDRFKIINDSLGHAEGDELLKQIARRLESATRAGDLLARFGGDEFVILLSEMLEANDAVQIAERIREDLKNPFELDGNEVLISASIGIALSTAKYKRAEDMLRDADIAMYRAKAKGKARYQIFDQSLHARATTQLQFETEMRQALERREFELHYQPIINLANGELTGFEALVRWRHPRKDLIPPCDFIPAAEETGLILPLGRWILDESCRQLREWQNAHPQASSLYVSVNLSCKQFLQSNLAEQVAETLAATRLAPRCLKLEITESYLIEKARRRLKL